MGGCASRRGWGSVVGVGAAVCVLHFLFYYAHITRPATITMKTVFNEIFEQVSHSQQELAAAERERERGKGGSCSISTYAEKWLQ